MGLEIKILAALLCFAVVAVASLQSQEDQNQRLTPDAAIARLMAGNDRFKSDKLEHPDRTKFRRELTASRQRPFAIVLGCSDSRVSPEIVFDQGIGDVFTIRVAGNVIGPLELDSIEFSIIHNFSSVVMVLGHESCGAVTAVMENNTKDIESIADLIVPAIRNVKKEGGNIEAAIKANVKYVVDQLRRSPVIMRAIESGQVKVVGGYYNLRTGQVDLI